MGNVRFLFCKSCRNADSCKWCTAVRRNCFYGWHRLFFFRNGFLIRIFIKNRRSDRIFYSFKKFVRVITAYAHNRIDFFKKPFLIKRFLYNVKSTKRKKPVLHISCKRFWKYDKRQRQLVLVFFQNVKRIFPRKRNWAENKVRKSRRMLKWKIVSVCKCNSLIERTEQFSDFLADFYVLFHNINEFREFCVSCILHFVVFLRRRCFHKKFFDIRRCRWSSLFKGSTCRNWISVCIRKNGYSSVEEVKNSLCNVQLNSPVFYKAFKL